MGKSQEECPIILPKYVAVEFPGIVKNIDKALEMLGGIKKVETCFYKEQPLHFLPEPKNPLEKGAISDRSELTSGENSQLIIKVRKNKLTNKQSIVVMGEVITLYSFKVMTDFLVIPTEAPKNAKEIPKDLSGALFPRTSREAYGWIERPVHTQEPFLPPFTFSRYGVPSSRMLCRELEDEEYEKFVATKGHGTNMRMERKKFSVVVQKDEPFPKEATKAAISEAELRCKNEEVSQKMEALFEERPMWTRGAIIMKAELDEKMVKFLLPKYAFYIQNGPFSRLWCKFGYDPRKDKSSFKYQTIMIAIKRIANVPDKSRTRPIGPERVRSFQEAVDDNASEHIYREGVLPKSRQLWFSFCDVLLPAVQEELNQIKIHPLAKYDKNIGWLGTNFMNFARNEVKKDITKIASQIDDQEITVLEEEDWDE
uniref:General transcription factor 3C polypeptide 5 n=1 Tax=Rhabditophanes sp. KR3021 TaxID=114890 RepID=A0AC35TLQ1_9BILA